MVACFGGGGFGGVYVVGWGVEICGGIPNSRANAAPRARLGSGMMHDAFMDGEENVMSNAQGPVISILCSALHFYVTMVLYFLCLQVGT